MYKTKFSFPILSRRIYLFPYLLNRIWIEKVKQTSNVHTLITAGLISRRIPFRAMTFFSGVVIKNISSVPLLKKVDS